MTEPEKSKLVLDEDEGTFIVQWRMKNLNGEDVYGKRDFLEFGEAFECFHFKTIISCVEWALLEDGRGSSWEYKKGQ